jgi:hypothetical protein
MISAVNKTGIVSQSSGYLYDSVAVAHHLKGLTYPSTGTSALLFLLNICDSITLVGFSGADENAVPSWYHILARGGTGKAGGHAFGLEGSLREKMRKCLHNASGQPRITILE